ncbi:hypothetical protein HBE96_23075 [Clostridium sp. P21]|uniref:Uncharacterized protein n=1 Tax=Clostridium muellerianum TaxID=2716538 RepID=A0A7Y0EL35_9CLOT|nr:hypothetical protein [Clostridium muellerianum]NMM65464.1 hypothetical protein [Clostridium muellerianum]
MLWEELERKKASERQAISGSKNLGLVMDTVPQLEKGSTRDIIANKIKLGAGRTYTRAKIAALKNNIKFIKIFDL